MKAALSERLVQARLGAAGPRRAKTTGLERPLWASLLPPAALAVPAGIFHLFKSGTRKTHSLPVCRGARVFFHSEAEFRPHQQHGAAGALGKRRGVWLAGNQKAVSPQLWGKGRPPARVPTGQSPHSCSRHFLFTPLGTHCFCVLGNYECVHSLTQ